MTTDVATILDRAEAIELCQRDLRSLGEALPEDPGELDGVFERACAQRREVAFTHLALAALHQGRDVRVSHLVEGGALFLEMDHFVRCASRMAGELSEGMIAALDRGTMSVERELVGICMAVDRWRIEHADEPVPLKLVAHARKLARRSSGYYPEAAIHLWVIQGLTGDETIRKHLEENRQHSPKDLPKTIEWIMGFLRGFMTAPVLCAIPETPGPKAASGYTVRRAAPRIGRNDVCPCGSGKKYKRCCQARDQERLKDSSEIAGVTRKELEERKEEFLTVERLIEMRSYEVVKLDPRKVAAGLFPVYLNRLMMCEELEKVAEIYEVAELGALVPDHWFDAIERCCAHRQFRHLADRLFRARPANCNPDEALSLSCRIFQLRADGEAALALLEEAALEAVRDDDGRFHKALDVAHATLYGDLPGLGILLARGTLPFVAGLDRDMLEESVQETRAGLGLEINDPVEDICDLLLAHEQFNAGPQVTKAERESQKLIQSHVEETRKLKNRLGELTKTLEDKERTLRRAREAERKPASAGTPATTGEAEETIRELRSRLHEVQDALHSRHRERNALRRELEQVKSQGQQPVQPAGGRPQAGEAQADEDEEALLLAAGEGMEGTQPLRLPVFPSRFRRTLEHLPAHVGAAAMEMIGRLAAGHPAAFHGVRKIRLKPNLLRQRVAASYRLLFEVNSDALQVVDLVHRRDLEGRLKTL
ncbi:MAG TPA: SEC-C metal-binding domain-containing protein [Verrucomicrobiales bacterium]|nr:SEC-C metal-binding domain-containing protein [Verrucomicrobiales bacterium]